MTKTKEKDTGVKVVGAVDNVADQPHVESIVIEPTPSAPEPVFDGNAEQMKAEFDKQIGQAYEATIATFVILFSHRPLLVLHGEIKHQSFKS